MIDFLIRFESPQFVDAKVGVDPGDVPVSLGMRQSEGSTLLIWLKSGTAPAEGFFGYVFYQVVANLSCIEYNLIIKLRLKLLFCLGALFIISSRFFNLSATGRRLLRLRLIFL